MSNQASNMAELIQPGTQAIDQSKLAFLYKALWVGAIVAGSMSVIRLQYSLLMGFSEMVFAITALIMAYYLRRNPQNVNGIGNAAICLYWLIILAVFILAPYNKTRFVLFCVLAAAVLFLKGRKNGVWWVLAMLASVVITHALMPDSGYSNLDILTGALHTLTLLVIFEFHEKMVWQQHAQLHKINRQLDEQVHQRTLELQEANKTLQLEKEQLRTLTFHDHLTGLYNRQRIEEVFEYEKCQLDRYHEQFSLILIDVDYFKLINDRYGHETGDDTLKEIANILKRHTRKSDIVARWGGDEFIIIATKTNLQQGNVLAESIRNLVERADIKTIDGNKITVSIGISAVLPDDNLKTMLRRADNALYEAKHAGRNRVELQ